MALIGSMTGSLTQLISGSNISYLAAGSNISIATGSNGQVTVSSTVAATVPGGSANEIQFNDAGSFGADNSFSFNKTTKVVNMTSASFYHASASLGVYAPVFHSGIFTLTDAATVSWDLDSGSIAQVTLGGARALAAPTNQRVGGTYTLIVKQDATGNRTLSFNSTYKFPYGVDPTMTTGSNAIDVVTFISDGTSMLGSYAQDLR